MADTTTTRYGLTKPGNLDAAGAGLWGPKLNTDFDLIDSEIAFPRYPVSSPTIGATTTFDLSLGRVFALTVTQITTFAFANVPAAGGNNFSTRIRLILTNGGAFTVTWPASVTWLSGVAPGLNAGGVDEIELVTKNGGTTWYAGMRGESRIIAPRNNVDAGTGANTTEVTLHTVNVPAGSMGANGVLDITVLYDITGSGGTKTLRLKFGGTVFNSVAFAAGDAHKGMMTCVIVNQNNVSVQYGDGLREVPGTALMQPFGGAVGAINTAVAQSVIVTGQTPTGADEITVKSTIVRTMFAG